MTQVCWEAWEVCTLGTIMTKLYQLILKLSSYVHTKNIYIVFTVHIDGTNLPLREQCKVVCSYVLFMQTCTILSARYTVKRGPQTVHPSLWERGQTQAESL